MFSLCIDSFSEIWISLPETSLCFLCFSDMVSKQFFARLDFSTRFSFSQKLGFSSSKLSSMASSDQASASITIDESHPFFLHHAKSPSAILIP